MATRYSYMLPSENRSSSGLQKQLLRQRKDLEEALAHWGPLPCQAAFKGTYSRSSLAPPLPYSQWVGSKGSLLCGRNNHQEAKWFLFLKGKPPPWQGFPSVPKTGLGAWWRAGGSPYPLAPQSKAIATSLCQQAAGGEEQMEA